MKTIYLHIREFIYGWDWTETDENENVVFYNTREEAESELNTYIQDVNREHQNGNIDEPYQDDCKVAEAQTDGDLITCEFVKNPFKLHLVKKSLPQRTVTVIYSDDSEITTRINGTDAEILEYFAVGKWFNIGSEKDNMQKISKCIIHTLDMFKEKLFELAISDYGMSETDFYNEEIQQAFDDNDSPEMLMDYLAKKYDLQNINNITG